MNTRGASWRSRLAFWRKHYDWPEYLEAMRRITHTHHQEKPITSPTLGGVPMMTEEQREQHRAEVRRELHADLERSPVPRHNHDSLVEWLCIGRPVGGFLESVLCNDLRGAVGEADDTNLRHIPDLVRWLYNHAPIPAWGNASVVRKWHQRGGLFRWDVKTQTYRAYDEEE